jgi:hypothetical protein
LTRGLRDITGQIPEHRLHALQCDLTSVDTVEYSVVLNSIQTFNPGIPQRDMFYARRHTRPRQFLACAVDMVVVGEPVFLFNEVDFFSKQIIGKVNSYQYFNQLNLNKQDAINLAKKFGGYVGEYDNKGGYYIYFSNNDLAMQFARSDEFERVWSESQSLVK